MAELDDTEKGCPGKIRWQRCHILDEPEPDDVEWMLLDSTKIDERWTVSVVSVIVQAC